MGLQNETPVTDFGYSSVAQCLRLAIVAQNVGSSVVVGKLPRGAMVLGGGVQVVEGFEGGVLTVTGQPGDIDVLANIDLTAVAFTPIDPGSIMSGDEVEIVATADIPPAPPPEPPPETQASGSVGRSLRNVPVQQHDVPGLAFIAILFVPPKMVL